jgi:N-acetylglucosaminyldiphosphoundecaprenol N-acetyl-beta-D-mannosaminyltransferase
MQPCSPFPRVNILGVGVSAIHMQQALDQIMCWIEHRFLTYVVVAPVSSIMYAHQDPTLRQVINAAGMVTPDGMPLVFLGRWMGYRHVDRVYGPDLMLAASALMAERGYTSFYYGGAEKVPEMLADRMAARFPGLKIVGTYSPPFRALTLEEDAAVVARINAANPDVVWVALGNPKQEIWMAEHRPRLNAPVLIGVGAAFDFHTGRIPQAPRWMQRRALEWLFRLATEPRRLWRRYLIYNPLFMFFMMLQITGLRRIPLDHS